MRKTHEATYPKSVNDVMRGSAELRNYWRGVLSRAQAQTWEEPTPPTACPTCGGLGVYTLSVPYDDPQFGKMQHCRDCDIGRDLAAARADRLLDASGLPDEYAHCTFESFISLPHASLAGKEMAYAACLAFAQNAMHRVNLQDVAAQHGGAPDKYPNTTKQHIVLTGSYRLGKTGLAAAVVNALAARGEKSLYIRVDDLIRRIQATYGKRAPGDPQVSAIDLIQAAQRAPVLVLDELPDHATPDRREHIESIIRYRHGYGLPTIITTNMSQEQCEVAWGPRITYVLREMAHWIAVSGAPLTDLGEVQS